MPISFGYEGLAYDKTLGNRFKSCDLQPYDEPADEADGDKVVTLWTKRSKGDLQRETTTVAQLAAQTSSRGDPGGDPRGDDADDEREDSDDDEEVPRDDNKVTPASDDDLFSGPLYSSGSDDESLSSDGDDTSVADAPTTCTASTSEPVADAPTTSTASTSEPVADAPTTSTASTSEAVADAPTTSTASTCEAVADAPTASTASTSEAVADAPTTCTASTSDAVADAPTTSTASTSEPVPGAPTTSAATTSEPVAADTERMSSVSKAEKFLRDKATVGMTCEISEIYNSTSMPEREVRDAATGAVPIRKVPTSDKDVTARVPGLNVKTAVDVKFDKFWAKYGNDIASGYVDLRIRAVDLEPSSDPSDTAVGDSAIDAAAPSNAKEDDISDDAGQADTMNTTSTSGTILYHPASASPSEIPMEQSRSETPMEQSPWERPMEQLQQSQDIDDIPHDHSADFE